MDDQHKTRAELLDELESLRHRVAALEANQELHESEEKYRHLFRDAALGIFHSTFDGKFIDVNPALAAMLGYASPEEVLASIYNIAAQIYAEPPRRDPIVQQALASGDIVHIENHYRRKDGSTWYGLLHLRMVKNAQGQPTHLEGFVEDISERKQTEGKIQKTLAEKEALLSELHHRTKNNMGVIIGLLGLQASYIQDERLSQAFEEIQNRIHVLALAHEHLYEANDLSHVNLKEYIHDLTQLLRKSYPIAQEQVSFAMKMEDVFVLIDIATPCGLLLHELIANALTHAFPGERKGQVSIELRRLENGEIYLAVADDGVGWPVGFDPRQDGRMGMQMIFALAEGQLKARLEFKSAPGVSCQLHFRDDLYTPRI